MKSFLILIITTSVLIQVQSLDEDYATKIAKIVSDKMDIKFDEFTENLNKKFEEMTAENQQSLTSVLEQFENAKQQLKNTQANQFAQVCRYGNYFIHDKKVSYDEGDKICKKLGGRIPEMTDANFEDKLDAIIDTFKKQLIADCSNHFYGIYIGLRKHAEIWKWNSSGKPLHPLKNPWSGGEPNDALGLENCTFAYAKIRKLNDTPCSSKVTIICELDHQ
jgi:hypothetical protein